MLSRLIRFSIGNPSLVLMTAVAMLILAIVRLPRTPVDVFPELNAPTAWS